MDWKYAILLALVVLDHSTECRLDSILVDIILVVVVGRLED